MTDLERVSETEPQKEDIVVDAAQDEEEEEEFPFACLAADEEEFTAPKISEADYRNCFALDITHDELATCRRVLSVRLLVCSLLVVLSRLVLCCLLSCLVLSLLNSGFSVDCPLQHHCSCCVLSG
jgi:hypothetical protein